MPDEVLSDAEIDHFLRRGFVKIPQALDRDLAKRWVDASWARIGYDRDDHRTWKEPRVHFPRTEECDPREVAPRAWAAMCQLVGGEERIHLPPVWGNGFIANYGIGADQPWVEPGPRAGGWHKDGDFFMHFLDSPEQALLTIILWDDVVHQGGPTYLACDSVPHVVRHLAAHPEGVNPMGRLMPELGPSFPHLEFVERCSDFAEATGERGDVFLMHPFLLHAQSNNVLRRARFVTNPPIRFREPMRFDRERGEDHSPVERAVLNALGVERFAFTPTAPRRGITPPRVAQQQKLLDEERRRQARIS
jgi:hypothetical protein